jgi:Zn-dependent protease with chaperone function
VKIAVLLLGYAALLGAAGPWLLRRGWADHAPRLAVAAWQALTATVVAAVTLGALALALPAPLVSVNIAHLLEACVLALRAQYATPGGAAVASTASLLAVTVLARCTWCTAAELLGASAQRRRHRDALTLLGRPDRRLGAVVLEHAVPAAYCLPGRHRRIVLTTAALAALDDQQLQAVLAHEQAHLRGRHDLVVSGAAALERTFPRVPLFRIARGEVTRLVELLADDAAAQAAPRLTLAEALLTVAAGAGPAGALGAGGTKAGPGGQGCATGERIRRLIAEPRPISRARIAAGFAGLAGLLALPVLLFSGPAAAAMPMDACQVPADCTSLTIDCPPVTPGRHDCPRP